MRRRVYRKKPNRRRLSRGQRKQLLRPVPLQSAQVALRLAKLESVDIPPDIPEKAFQALVQDAAKLLGWMTYHPHDSRRSTPGWPDLAILREDAFLVAELKTQKGRVSPEQQVWLEVFRSAGIPAFLWRPSDWKSIAHTLANPNPVVSTQEENA